jgi:hypothetical protein
VTSAGLSSFSLLNLAEVPHKNGGITTVKTADKASSFLEACVGKLKG